MEPNISVIIPCKNAEGTIQRALRSCLAQTYPDLEILVIDDGSTDGTRKRAEALARADPRIRVLSCEGKGVSDARNTGLSAMRGEYVTFLDADDAMDPELVETLYHLQQKTGAGITGCTFTMTGERTGTGKTEIFTGKDICLEALQRNDTRIWSKLITRETVGERRFAGGLTIGEDMLFFFSLVLAGTRYALVDSPLYLYTVNPEGAMEKPFTPSFMDQLTCWDMAEKTVEENMPGAFSGEIRGRLLAKKVVSGTLTAMKIAKLPSDEARHYSAEFERCRDYVRKNRTKEALSFLPRDYKVKSSLLLSMPSLYRKLYSGR